MVDGRSSVDEEEEEARNRIRGVIREEKEKNASFPRPIKIANGRAPVIATDRLLHSEDTANLNRSNEEVFRDRTRDQPRNLIGHVVWSPDKGGGRDACPRNLPKSRR